MKKEVFFDVRCNRPKKGQILALYTAMAEFISGPEKQNIIDLLKNTEKAIAVSQVMKKLICASELDSFRVPIAIAEDILKGLTDKEILDKIYKFKMEMYFYALPQDIPVDDPHWSTISLVDLTEKSE